MSVNLGIRVALSLAAAMGVALVLGVVAIYTLASIGVELTTSGQSTLGFGIGLLSGAPTAFYTMEKTR